MKKPELYLKEYCQRLSDDHLKFLELKLGQRLGSDLAEALDFLSGVREIDRLLAVAQSSDEFYDIIDMIQLHVMKECETRYKTAA